MKTLNSTTVTILVSNLDSAVHFYTSTLEFVLIQRYGEHYAEVDARGLKIGLHPTKDPIKIGNNMSIGFGVPDFDKVIAGLEAKGIKFRINQEGWVRLGHFSDPDGNPLYIAEIKEVDYANN